MSDIVNSKVLVLNQDYRPVNICRVRRAVVLVLQGKAEVMENGLGEMHSIGRDFPIPLVIHLSCMVNRPHFEKRVTRVEIFNRDNYTCQYCGREAKELTLDHVIPRYRGGEHVWENIVSCCIPCNRRKAGRTPREAGMRLLHHPRAPQGDGFIIPAQYLKSHTEWRKFLA